MSKNAKPVRILYVDTGIGLGGGQHSLIEIVKFLDTSRFQPVVCSPPTSALKTRCDKMGVVWVPLPFESAHLTSKNTGGLPGVLRDMATSLFGIFYLAGLVRRQRIDLVHANTFKAALACCPVSAVTGRPLLFHDRVHLSHRGLARLVGLFAGRTIAISRSAAAKHSRRLSHKMKIIPPGVDTDRILPAVRAEGPPTVCYIGRISEEKCIEKLIEAAPRVIREIAGVRFVVAGSPFTSKDQTYFEYIMGLVDELSLSDRFEFPGYIEDVPGLLARCDVLVLPSRMEALGRVLLEAMAAGKPVIAFAAGGPEELITSGETGVLVESGSVKGVAEAIVQVLGDEALRMRMGAGARQRVVAGFSSRLVAARIMDVYDNMLDRSG